MRIFIKNGIFSFLLILFSCSSHKLNPLLQNEKFIFKRYPFISDSHGSELNKIALNYFGIASADTCIRIWIRDYSEVDSFGYYSVKLFEIGYWSEFIPDSDSHNDAIKVNNYYACYNIFEIEGRTDIYPPWRIKKVSTEFLSPNSGWNEFMGKVKEEGFDKMYLLPKGQEYQNYCYECHLSIEYIHSEDLHSLDFTGFEDIDKSKFLRDKSFLQFVYLIESEFGVTIGKYQLPWPNSVETK